MRGQYPSILRHGPRRRALGRTLALALALAPGLLGGCARPVLLVLLDPLFVAAEPEAAASLSRFRLPGHAARVRTLDPLEPAPDLAGFDAVLASPLALARLAEGPAARLPRRLYAIDAPESPALGADLRVARFERGPAWKAAGTLAGAFLKAGGTAAVVVREGKGRSALRAADFSDGVRGNGAEPPLTRVLGADTGPEDLDRALDALLAQDVRLVALSVGAQTPRAARRLGAAGVVIVADQPSAWAAFLVEDDYAAALKALVKSDSLGSGAVAVPSRLIRGPGLAAAAARHPALLGLSKGLPR